MTTHHDLGSEPGPAMLLCPESDSGLYPTLVLALRDMRTAHHRDAVTGVGPGTESWIGLALGMVVLDTLTSAADDVNRRWVQLLTNHGVPDHDARVIYAVRNSILHGYGPPRPEKAENRTVRFIGDPAAHAVDTRTPRFALISVPAFCSRLVERIAAESPTTWNTEEIDTRFGEQVT